MDLGDVDREDEDNALVDALRAYGVRFLSGGALAQEPHSRTDSGRFPMDAQSLLAGMATSLDPRLRHALPALFLRNPELASVVRQVAATLPQPAHVCLIRGYVAAVYLQHLWRTRLRRYLGDAGELPPYWIEEMGLPSPEERFGKVGLATLAALPDGAKRAGRRTLGRGTLLGEYYKVSRLLLAQLLTEQAFPSGAANSASLPT